MSYKHVFKRALKTIRINSSRMKRVYIISDDKICQVCTTLVAITVELNEVYTL